MSNIYTNKNNIYLGYVVGIMVIILSFGFIANLKLFYRDLTIKNGVGLLFHFLTIFVLLVKMFILFSKRYEIRQEAGSLIISTHILFNIKYEKRINLTDIEFKSVKSYLKSHLSSEPIAKIIVQRKEMLRRLFGLNCRNYVVNKYTGKRLINDLSDEDVVNLKKTIEISGRISN